MSELLYVIATELCDAVVDCLKDAGLEPPGRRFVDIGGVLAPVEFGDDCESQLSCYVGPLSPSRATNLDSRASSRGSCALLWNAKFTIVMLRCHPIEGHESRGLPSPESIDEQANLALRDGWQITRCMSRRWTQGELVPSYSFDCENVQWGSVTALPPQGGIRGWTLVLDVTVNEPYVPIDGFVIDTFESDATLRGRGDLSAQQPHSLAILDGRGALLASGMVGAPLLDEDNDDLLDEDNDDLLDES